jgi:hypothetical protein
MAMVRNECTPYGTERTDIAAMLVAKRRVRRRGRGI